MAATLFLSATNVSQVANHLKENVIHASTVYLNLTYPGRNTPEIQNEEESSSFLNQLQASAATNHTITKLIISGGCVDAEALNQGHGELDQWYQSIIEALGHLTHLEILTVEDIRVVTFTAVIGPALSRFLPRAAKLQSLQLVKVQFSCQTAQQFMSEWGVALKVQGGNPKELIVRDCHLVSHPGLEPPPESSRCILHPLIASLSKLNRVCFSGRPPLVSLEALQELLSRNSSSLRRLEYTGVGPGKELLVASIAPALLHLESLVTDFRFTPPEFAVLAALLEQSTTLQAIRLERNRYQVEIFNHPLHHTNYTRGMTAIAKALHHNTTLQAFVICPSLPLEGSKALTTALVEALESNYTLHFVKLFRGRLIRRLEFLCELNRRGRGAMLASVESKSRQEWVEKLIAEKEDLSSICYYLQASPWLCDVHTQ